MFLLFIAKLLGFESFLFGKRKGRGIYVCLLVQDAGVHALSNVCHVGVEHVSKRKPGEVVIIPCYCLLFKQRLLSRFTYAIDCFSV